MDDIVASRIQNVDDCLNAMSDQLVDLRGSWAAVVLAYQTENDVREDIWLMHQTGASIIRLVNRVLDTLEFEFGETHD